MSNGQAKILEGYFENVPQDQKNGYAFLGNMEDYRENFEKLIDKKEVPVWERIDYNSDTWDFRPYFISRSPTQILRFSTFSSDSRDMIKQWAIFQILKINSKISTIQTKLSYINSFFKYLNSEKGQCSILLVTTGDIISFKHKADYSYGVKANILITLKSLFKFIEYNYGLPLDIDYKVLKNESEKETHKKNTNLEDSKIKNIPDKLYRTIVDKSISVMRDENAKYDFRAMACMILILSQTGLRPSDLTMLEINALRTTTLPNTGYTAYYIHFTVQKSTKADEKLREFDIYASPIAVDAFKTLLDLRKQCRFSDEPYLYVIEPYRKKFDKFPISGANFSNQYKHFLYEYLHDVLTEDWENISRNTFNPHTLKEEELSCPDLNQFRVYVCTDLYNKGVPLLFIKKYMGHLESQMEGYYVRPKDHFQENTAFAGKVIREMVEGYEPQGLFGKEIREAVVKFIKENNLNVYDDIEGVVKAFGDKLTIRAKDGGACIVCKMFGCSQDNRTNEILCAYNLCPNIYHFFYSIDMTYQTFKTIHETYRINLKNGHTRAAEKELHKAKEIINRRLLKEIEELEKEINKRSLNEILDHYPSLVDIIENLDEIKKEASIWRTM